MTAERLYLLSTCLSKPPVSSFSISTDSPSQLAVERELVQRLASLLWRLRWATTIETGLFEIQAAHLSDFRKARQICSASREIVYALFKSTSDRQAGSPGLENLIETNQAAGPASIQGQAAPDVELARCFLRLCNLPNYAPTASAGMKLFFGVKPGKFFMHSTIWIAANHRRECGVSVLEMNKHS
jgi:hypothetical protein